MGVISPQQMDDWDRQQREEYAQKAKYQMVALPCCGSAVEAKPEEGDQYVTCPNQHCPKRAELGRAPRHMISWSLNPKISSELQS